MPRYATCIDPQPQPDGSCQNVAWIEYGGIADMLPDYTEATAVGFAFFASLIIIALAKRTLKPQ
jgi:hypothetical protein